MDKELVKSLRLVATQLASMERSEFLDLLVKSQDGDISYFLGSITEMSQEEYSDMIKIENWSEETVGKGFFDQSYISYGYDSMVTISKTEKEWELEWLYPTAA